MKPDFELVCLFLRKYKQGHYAHSVEKITQSQSKDVEAIGRSATGEGLAVEHTLLVNFPNVWRKEKWIKETSEQLRNDASLRIPERSIWVFLPAEAFDTSQPWCWTELGAALTCWARCSFAALPIGCSTHDVTVPASGAPQSLNIKTTVSETPGSPGTVSVGGLFPEDATPLHDPDAEAMRYLCPELERTIQNKLPKLLKKVADKQADKAVLLLELNGALIQRNWVTDQLRSNSRIEKLDAVALVYTSGIPLQCEVSFVVWHPCSNEWGIPWTEPLPVHHP